jgi:hypothetical protein
MTKSLARKEEAPGGAPRIHPQRKKEDRTPHKTKHGEQVAGNASEDQNLHSATGVEAEETKAPRSYLAVADAGSPAITNEEELDAPY